MVNRAQYLYVAQLGDGVLKIGISCQPAVRVRKIGHIGKRRPILIWQTDTPILTARETETRVKVALWRRRISGEWFVCTQQKMERVIRRAISETGSGPVFVPAIFGSLHHNSQRRMPY